VTILDQAVNLGRQISETLEYKEMKKNEEILRADELARQLMDEFQILQNTYEKKAKDGEPITEENFKELENLEKRAMEYESVRCYFESNMRFQNLVKMVNNKIMEGILGEVRQSGIG